MFLTLLLATLVGVSLGLLGSGGSILAVPILVYVAEIEARQAIATSLAIVGTVSAAGALWAWRADRVRPGMALRFGGCALLGTYAGTQFAGLVTPRFQLGLFAVVMIAASLSMLRSARQPEAPAQTQNLIPAALAVGLLTGLVGVGGGFLIVPALVTLGGVPMLEAVGTSLVVIAMNSAVGVLGYMGQVDVPWGLAAGFVGAAGLGVVAGGRLAGRFSAPTLKRAFAVLVLCIGAFILLREWLQA